MSGASLGTGYIVVKKKSPCPRGVYILLRKTENKINGQYNIKVMHAMKTVKSG